MIYNLSATRQKSYYGKAKVIEENGKTSLVSYSTKVCEIENGRFVRLWGGYSRTTANHINDFRRLYGLPTLSKKEWEALPCDNGERYKVEFSNGFVSWSADVTFDNYEDAEAFAEDVNAKRNYSLCYGVYPV